MIKVLVVDDDKIIRKGLISIISNNTSEFEIIGEAANGARALEVIEELKPQIVITDIKMPIMDGVELMEEISRRNLDIKVAVLSGFDEFRYVRSALKSGARDYLLKPFENDALIELLMRLKAEIEQELEVKARINLFANKMEEADRMLQERYLSKIVQCDSEYILRNREEFGQLASLGPDYGFLLMVIGFDELNPKERNKQQKDNYSVIDNLKNSIYGVVGSKGLKEELFICDKDRNHILIYIKLRNAEKRQTYINDLIDDIRSNSHCEFPISIGISKYEENIERIKDSYYQCMKALDFRFYMGKESTIHYDTVENLLRIELTVQDYETEIDVLANNIEICNEEKAVDIIDRIMKDMQKKYVDPEKLRRIISSMITKYAHLQPEFSCAVHAVAGSEEELQFCINRAESFEELFGYTKSMLRSIIREMKVVKSERSKNIIEKAKTYIREHYMEEVSLKNVADEVYLNPNYFSELFKAEVGANFIDYLIECRINAAKEMLKQPSMKIYEVAEAVGYKEPVSFNRAFKKVVGVSPKEYVSLVK